MKDLIKQYLDQGLSRRQLVSGLSALGMSTVAAKAMAQNLSPAAQSAAPAAAAAPAAIREVEGNGGKLFVEQLKAAGVEHIFFNPSTGDHPIFDALVDVPEINLIKGIQEGAVVAMADGYARAFGPHRRRRRRQYRPAQRHDPDGQYLEGPDSDAGRSRLRRSGRARPRPVAGDRSSRADDGADHQMVLAGAVDGGVRRDDAARLEIRFDAAMRPGVFVAADQYARWPCQGAGLGAQQVRRADAHPPRQGRRREGGAHADRSAEPADQHRRRDHLVPRPEGIARARRAARRAGRRRDGQSRLLVETIPDPASAVHRHASAHHALSGKTRRAAQSRQSLGRAGGARHQTDFDPARSGEPRAQRAGRSRHGGRSAVGHRRSHRGDPQHGDRVEAQGYRRAARGKDPRLFGADGRCAASDRARAWRILRRSAWSGSGSSSKPISTATPATSPTSIPAKPWIR